MACASAVRRAVAVDVWLVASLSLVGCGWERYELEFGADVISAGWRIFVLGYDGLAVEMCNGMVVISR